MITEASKEYNFVFELLKRPDDTKRWYVMPASLQMGWKNSPAFFCTGTEATRELIRRLLALTKATGIDVYHRHEHHCIAADLMEPQTHTPALANWQGLGACSIAC